MHDLANFQEHISDHSGEDTRTYLQKDTHHLLVTILYILPYILPVSH